MLLQGASTPGTGGNEITYISWNCKVQHILASSSANGTTVVWDLKRQKPVISFRDPNRYVCARAHVCVHAPAAFPFKTSARLEPCAC